MYRHTTLYGHSDPIQPYEYWTLGNMRIRYGMSGIE